MGCNRTGLGSRIDRPLQAESTLQARKPEAMTQNADRTGVPDRMDYIFSSRRRARLIGQRVQRDHTGPENSGGIGWDEDRFSLEDLGSES